MHYGATIEIFERAKELRGKMTETEKLLWKKLSKNQLGCKFRRQHPISYYIADFYCHEHKLIIEVDGNIHLGNNQKFLDSERTRDLQELGLTIIRFTNNQVINQIDFVIESINYELTSKAPKSPKGDFSDSKTLKTSNQ